MLWSNEAEVTIFQTIECLEMLFHRWARGSAIDKLAIFP
jgi:hypothetical protein